MSQTSNKVKRKHTTTRCKYTEDWKNKDIDLNISLFEFRLRLYCIIHEVEHEFVYYTYFEYYDDYSNDYIYTLKQYYKQCLNKTVDLQKLHKKLKNIINELEDILTINKYDENEEYILKHKRTNEFIEYIKQFNIITESFDKFKEIYDNDYDLFINDIKIIISLLNDLNEKRTEKFNEIILSKISNDDEGYNRLLTYKLLYDDITSISQKVLLLNTKYLRNVASLVGDIVYKVVEDIINYDDIDVGTFESLVYEYGEGEYELGKLVKLRMKYDYEENFFDLNQYEWS